MGFLTKLLSRAPQADPELWQPTGPGVPIEDDAVEIFGSGAVTEIAYRVDFTLGIAPGAKLMLWAGVVEADPDTGPGLYAVDYRGEWWLDGRMIAAWVDQDTDSYGDDHLGQADANAAAVIHAYASCYPRTGDEPFPDDGLTEQFFEWDGQPLPVAAGAHGDGIDWTPALPNWVDWSCPACGAEDYEDWSDDGHTVYVCTACGAPDTRDED